MISGTLYCSTVIPENPAEFNCSQEENTGELMMRHVECGSFIGEYMLHPRLPWKDSDFYYHNKEKDVLVLLSGEVYNKEQLLSDGTDVEPTGTPALVASLFINDGPGFAEKLNGDFAIFIYKPLNGDAYLYRDHVGVRPISWFYTGSVLGFSSDIIGLSRTKCGGGPVPGSYLADYFRYSDKKVTPCPGVHRLLPGHYLHYSGNAVSIKKYWFPGQVRERRSLSYDTVLSELRDLLMDSVRIRCDHRFMAGAHLSSGLDSGIVSALAREEYRNQERFYGFSWSPRDYNPAGIAYDERALVRLAAEKSGIEPVFSDMVAKDLVSSLCSVYGNPSLFYEERTMENSLSSGTNLIFSGWGGDEFISSGDRGVEQDLLRRGKFRLFFRRNPVRTIRRFISVQLKWVIFPALGILDRFTKRSLQDNTRYLKRTYRQHDRKALSLFYFHRSRRQMLLNQLEFYHLQRRCEEWMIKGYRRGFEYRYPLLDHRIIEYVISIPSDLLCRPGLPRPLLRDISNGILPEEVRQLVSKSDPVSQSYTWKMCREVLDLTEGEIAKWKDDPAMQIVDFDALFRDIDSFRKGIAGSEDNVLFRGVVFLKAIYEFARRYEGRHEGRV